MPLYRSHDYEFAQVAEMHQKFGLGVSSTPSPTGAGQPMEERITCMQEELLEFASAVRERDFSGMADALVDLVVFAKGTAVQLGLPWAELWEDVMRANMAKERGVGKRGHKVDLIKPLGWQGPKTAEILERHGWKRPGTVTEEDLDVADAAFAAVDGDK